MKRLLFALILIASPAPAMEIAPIPEAPKQQMDWRDLNRTGWEMHKRLANEAKESLCHMKIPPAKPGDIIIEYHHDKSGKCVGSMSRV